MTKKRGSCPFCGAAVRYETDPTCIDCQDPCEVTITRDDRAELYFMLRGRGGSGLKTKLLRALAFLDAPRAKELRNDVPE